MYIHFLSGLCALKIYPVHMYLLMIAEVALYRQELVDDTTTGEKIKYAAYF
jgi:hypothetical protein